MKRLVLALVLATAAGCTSPQRVHLPDAGRVLGTVSASHRWHEQSPFSPPNSIMGRLCDPKKIGMTLAHLSPDSPAMSLPFPPPPPPAAVQEEQVP